MSTTAAIRPFEIPLLTNPHIVKAWLKAAGVGYLFCMLIPGSVFIATGGMQDLPMLALIFLVVISGMILLGFLIMLVIAACMPLYALVEITDLHLMVPLLIMVFSLAMVWMIPLIAWVVLPLIACIPVYVVWALSGSVTIKLVSTYSYRQYQLLDAGEWIIIALAVAGLLYLSRISIKSLKGQYVPVLMRDRQKMDQASKAIKSGGL